MDEEYNIDQIKDFIALIKIPVPHSGSYNDCLSAAFRRRTYIKQTLGRLEDSRIFDLYRNILKLGGAGYFERYILESDFGLKKTKSERRMNCFLYDKSKEILNRLSESLEIEKVLESIA